MNENFWFGSLLQIESSSFEFEEERQRSERKFFSFIFSSTIDWVIDLLRSMNWRSDFILNDKRLIQEIYQDFFGQTKNFCGSFHTNFVSIYYNSLCTLDNHSVNMVGLVY